MEKWAARTWCCHSNRHGEGVGETGSGGKVGWAQVRDTVGREGVGRLERKAKEFNESWIAGVDEL